MFVFAPYDRRYEFISKRDNRFDAGLVGLSLIHISHKVGAVHFNIIPMTEETGFTLNVNPEKLEEVQEAIPTYSTLDLSLIHICCCTMKVRKKRQQKYSGNTNLPAFRKLLSANSIVYLIC